MAAARPVETRVLPMPVLEDQMVWMGWERGRSGSGGGDCEGGGEDEMERRRWSWSRRMKRRWEEEEKREESGSMVGQWRETVKRD